MRKWVFGLSLIMASCQSGKVDDCTQSNQVVERSCKHSENSFDCVKFIKNYDADTVTFEIDGLHPLLGKNISVRLLGIDAPEIRSKKTCEKDLAKKAKEFVRKELSRAKNITLQKVKRGKYFRIVADVIVDGNSLSSKIIEAGFAYKYDGGKKRKINWCKFSRKNRNKNTL